MATSVTDVPRIMRAQGWNNGARLMEIWLSRTAAAAPAYGPPEESTIRMDTWVLRFARARAVFDQLVRERVWANAAAQRATAAMLRRKGLLTPRAHTFGDVSLPASRQDADYVNFRVVAGSWLDALSLDDMSAALGRFVLRVTVAGQVAPVAGTASHRVTLTGIGVYVRDSYDFNGDQDLGYWDARGNRVSAVNPLFGDRVTNADFRSWRARTGLGGDFVVYSDVKRVSPSAADSFVV